MGVRYKLTATSDEVGKYYSWDLLRVSKLTEVISAFEPPTPPHPVPSRPKFHKNTFFLYGLQNRAKNAWIGNSSRIWKHG